MNTQSVDGVDITAVVAAQCTSYSNIDGVKDKDNEGWRILRESLLSERPTIDEALKSFASWWMARVLLQLQLDPSHDSINKTDAATQQKRQQQRQKDALVMTRCLSQGINAHIVAVDAPSSRGGMSSSFQRDRTDNPQDRQGRKSQNDAATTTATTAELVPQVWNEVQGMKHKPTKVLGQTALRFVWQSPSSDLRAQVLLQMEAELLKNGPSSVHTQIAAAPRKYHDDDLDREGDSDEDETTAAPPIAFLNAFERLLLAEESNSISNNAKKQDWDDSRFVWHADRGQSEMARRSAQRHERASAALRAQHEHNRQRRLEQETILEELGG